MRLTAYTLALFFICLNVSLYLINESKIIATEQPPYEEPESIISQVLHVDISGESLLLGGVALAASIIIGYVTRNFIYGGTIGIIIFAIDLFFPFLKWILFGFPVFLQQIGSPVFIVTAVNALMAMVWFWFFLGFIVQRQLER